MSKTYYHYKIQSKLIPAQINEILRELCEAPELLPFNPAFNFSWADRRLVLRADSPEVLNDYVARFMKKLRVFSGADEIVLPGTVAQDLNGRYQQSMGILLQEPATFTDLITITLQEIGIKKIEREDTPEESMLSIPMGVFNITPTIDFHSLVLGFPVPSYIEIIEENLSSL